jgi:tripartite-type tricarboxylate transporter receptor subunit TctC
MMMAGRVASMVMVLLGFGMANVGDRASAQSYPSKPIKMIVPFAPGGADVVARVVADRMAASLGQPVIVDNRPGGGGIVGTKATSLADADGYTLTLASPGQMTIAPAVRKNLEYDPIRDFAPVAMVAVSPFVLAINPALPVTSVQELIAYAKANPGKINFASPGAGTTSQLFGELLKQRSGIDIVHVPYRGSAPAIVDLVAGQIHMYFDNFRNLHPFFQSGKLRALAVTTENRAAEMPTLPTMIESGLAGFSGFYWNGVLAPVRTPAPVIGRLNAVINDGLNSAEMRHTITKLGMEPRPGTPQEFADLIAAEIKKWTAVAHAANLTID